jgi:hypothetical protein
MLYCARTCIVPVLKQYKRMLRHAFLCPQLYSTCSTAVQTYAATCCTVAVPVPYQGYRIKDVRCNMLYCARYCPVPVLPHYSRMLQHALLCPLLSSTSANALQTYAATCFTVPVTASTRSTALHKYAATWFIVHVTVKYQCYRITDVCCNMLYCARNCTVPVLPHYIIMLQHALLCPLLSSTRATALQTYAATWFTVHVTVQYQCYRITDICCNVLYCACNCTVPVLPRYISMLQHALLSP